MPIIKTFLKKYGLKLRQTSLGSNKLLGNLHGFLTILVHNSEYVNYGPFTIQFHKHDRIISKKLILYGEYEKREINILCSLIKPGDIVLDIGANIGLYTLFLSSAVGKDGKVIAVEPDPENVKILKNNLVKNKCKNVEVLEMALASKTEGGNLFRNDTNRGHSSLMNLNNTDEATKIQINRGDEILKMLNIKPDAAKIDVEGAEPEVIAGLGHLKPPIIQFEFVPEFFKILNNDPKLFLNSLVAENYNLELIDPDEGSLTSCSPESIISKAIGIFDYNILARKFVIIIIMVKYFVIDGIFDFIS